MTQPCLVVEPIGPDSKWAKSGKKKLELSLIVDMIIYVENPRESAFKPLEPYDSSTKLLGTRQPTKTNSTPLEQQYQCYIV